MKSRQEGELLMRSWLWKGQIGKKTQISTAGGENISSDLKNGGWKILTAIQVATSFVTMVARTIYNFLLINFFEFRLTRNEAFSVSAQLWIARDIKEHSLQHCDLDFFNEKGWSFALFPIEQKCQRKTCLRKQNKS